MKKIIALFLVLTLTLGMSLCLSSCASKNYFYSDGIGLSEGVVNYLCSYYKFHYMNTLYSQGYSVEDTEAFWSTPYYGLTSTLGDYLKYYGEKYIINLIASNLIFDENAKLTREDKVEIELAANEILTYYYGGDESAFDKDMTEKYGFDYKDLYEATEMLYKAYILEERVFASDIESYAYYYDEFFTQYKNVEFIYIDTTDFSAEDFDALEEYEDKVSECISKIYDEDADASELDVIIEEIKGNYSTKSEKHYVHVQSAFIEALYEENADVANAALELSGTDAVFVDIEDEDSNGDADGEDSAEKMPLGVCIVRGLSAEPEAYKNTEKEDFKDFYSLALSALVDKKISEYSARVSKGELWENFDPSEVPYNNEYVPIFY